MAGNIKIKRAIISVSDKTGLDSLGKQLQEMGVEIISTGGTLRALREAGINAISVSSFTGSSEILGGRVKTLHPKVHAGILCRQDNQDDAEQMAEAEYRNIDLVVVNLYPFKQTLARPESTDADIIENIDIGGPTMIRAAAKNHDRVTVVVDPADYSSLMEQLKGNDCSTDYDFRRECAAHAFAHTAEYDAAIDGYFKSDNGDVSSQFPRKLNLNYTHRSEPRYGENPHQQAALYSADGHRTVTLLDAEQLSGKELSFNNYGDLDATLDMVLDFDEPFACVLKHANPCGAAQADTIVEAYRLALECDPLSAFGSIIGLNREVDIECARLLHETQFVECILAPSYTEEAFKLLKKKKARRLLSLPAIVSGMPQGENVLKHIRGGLLAQSADTLETPESDLKTVTKRSPTPEEIESLLFGWKVVKHTKSNAIVLSKGTATVGIGMGQTSRVDSGFMAVKRAGDRARGATMASDAFYPMPDGIEVGTDAGVVAIIQPGGSKGDEAAIAAADKAGAAMVFTGARHFKH